MSDEQTVQQLEKDTYAYCEKCEEIFQVRQTFNRPEKMIRLPLRSSRAKFREDIDTAIVESLKTATAMSRRLTTAVVPTMATAMLWLRLQLCLRLWFQYSGFEES